MQLRQVHRRTCLDNNANDDLSSLSGSEIDAHRTM